jgi:aldehyde dehydrogenase (NAD+)
MNASMPLDRSGVYVDGDLMTVTSGPRFAHFFAGTGEQDFEYASAGLADVDDAVNSATDAAREWGGWTADRRRDVLLRLADLLERNVDKLVPLAVRDNSFPIRNGSNGPGVAARAFRYFAGWADKIEGAVQPVWPGDALSYSVPVPYGVVGIIAPWNGPIVNLGLTLAPALAAGNAVVLKPSEFVPGAAVAFARLCIEAGMPRGTVNVVVGDSVAGQALCSHTGVGKIHFTGSGATAKHVLRAAAEALTPVDVELGGKSPNVVFPDADIETAVGISISHITQTCGQVCIAASRLIVHRSISHVVKGIITRSLEHVRLGDPFDKETSMGPVISASARDRIEDMLRRAEHDGATVTRGGRRTSDAPGYFVEPAVVADAAPDSEISQEEVFGPVVVIHEFESDDEALEIANGSRYGLAAYVSTNDAMRAQRFARDLQAGITYVNGYGGLPPAARFGGVKSSGFGRLGGVEGVLAFTQSKAVWVAR